MGFEIVGEINRKPYYLYQMRKSKIERHSHITYLTCDSLPLSKVNELY